MTETFLYIFYTWTALMLLQLVGVGIVVPFLGSKLLDSGWALGRTVTWLLISLIVWFLGYGHIPVNTSWGVMGCVGAVSLLSLWLIMKHKGVITENLARAKAYIVTEELLFLLGFVGLSLMRSLKPEILDLEKFMDAGFMATYLRSPILPAPDMWLAGSPINYYSFGHFLGSIMTRIWWLRLEYSYNLLLALIMGLTFSLSFSVVINWLGVTQVKISTRLNLVAGIIGSLLVTLGGNMHTAWYWLTSGNWQGYWYASATRFIDRTIHEFPSYSFVVSDLHGHVWGLPLVFTFLIVLPIWFKALMHQKPSSKKSVKTSNFQLVRTKIAGLWRQEYLHFSVILGVIMGCMVMTNAWDLAIYGLLLVVLGTLTILYQPHRFFPLLLSGVVVGMVGLIVASPFFFNFESISEGAAVANEHSPLWQLEALWSGHVVVSFLAVVTAIKSLWRIRNQASKPYLTLFVILAVGLTAWLLILLPELIYVKDIYTGHPRANTMFKLTYQSFILMSLLSGWVLGFVWNRPRPDQALPDTLGRTPKLTSDRWKHLPGKLFVTIAVVTFFCASLLFPYFAHRDYFGFNLFKPRESLQKHQGLYGLNWLAEEDSDDFRALRWLQDNVHGQPVILEAVGESYTTFNRFSAFTGLPTVLGWRVHEWLWRGGFDIPGQRTDEVKLMYEQPLSAQAQEYYNLYKVQYIIVGAKEEETYQIDPQLYSLGETVFHSGDTVIIQRP